MRSWSISSIVCVAAILLGPVQVAAAGNGPNSALQFATTGAQPIFETVGHAQDLPSTSIFAIATDRYGFVWLAGDRGVHRFDGYSFYNLDRDPSLPDSLESRFVYLLAESDDGMWIGSPNSTVQRLDSRTGRLLSVPVEVDGITPQGNMRIASDALGQLWLMSDLGLLRLDKRGQTIRVAPRTYDAMGFNRDRTAVLIALPDNRVISIDVRDPEKKSTLLALPEGNREPITAMAADGTGLWLMAGRNLWRFDWAARTLTQAEVRGTLLRATDIVPVEDGSLWLGSVYDEGLQRYDPSLGTVSTFRNEPNDPQSLPAGPITALAVDTGNNLWIGVGSAGIRRLRLSQTALSRYPTKGAKHICALGEADGDRLVVSLCRDGLVVLNPQSGEMEPLRASSALPQSSNAFTSDRKGGLWITSVREGLFHWRPDGAVRRYPLNPKSDAPDPTMTGILLDDRDRLWITHHRGLSVLDPGARDIRAVEAYEGVKPFVFDLTQDVSAGPRGTLWIGTMKGVLNLDIEAQQIRRYEHNSLDATSLSDNYVLQTYTDKGGRLWMGTRAGLNRLMVDGNGRRSFRRYGLAEGLPDITIKAILSDNRGGLWVATSRGIAEWDERLDRFQSYLPSDGIPDTDVKIKAALSGTDGGLYFGMLTGLLRVDPRSLQIADPAPVVLSSFEVGDRTTVNLRGKDLPSINAAYSDSRVSFRIAVLGDSRRLSYRLLGLGDAWMDMPHDNTITFHRPPPGSYQLQVRQLQRDGVWGRPELSLAVEVSPPFWRTNWAYLLYAVVLLALMAASIRGYMARRHRALREQLKESHARLSVALSAARFGMWGWNPDTHEIDIDEFGCNLLAVPAGEPPGAELRARIHPDDIERVRSQFNDALRKDKAVDFEFRLLCEVPEPPWRWIEGHAVPYRHPGKAPQVIGVYRDSTQRKLELLEMEDSKQATEHALEELTRSRVKLAMALESGDLGVWRCELPAMAFSGFGSESRLTLDCDANVRRILGWPMNGDITLRRFLCTVHRQDRRGVLTRLTHVAMTGGSYTDRYGIVHPDGKVRCIATRVISVPNSDPTYGNILTGTVHDVTAEEALKKQLQEAAEQAQMATKAKGQFLAMMSHEIRTPINGVIGTIDLLSETAIDDEQSHLLRLCRDSAYVLLAIINDILDYSKIEAGKLDFEKTPTSLRRLVESVAESLRTQACEKGIRLDVSVAPDVPRRVLGDRVRLRQVLANLVGNAIKFTEQGGVSVHVCVSGADDEGRSLVRFDVVDTGIGMDDHVLESLFQPFQQADAATTRRFGGTGLGLTIVRHLATLMGGDVECISSVSSGSRFTVTIPLSPATFDGGRRGPAYPGVRVLALCESGERAILLHELCEYLCVETEIVMSFERLLERVGEAKDAATAPTLLLIDRGFSDAPETISRSIRERAGGTRIPVVLVRGDALRTAATAEQGVAIVAGSPLTSLELARGFQLVLGQPHGVAHVGVDRRSALLQVKAAPAICAEVLVAEDNATNREVISRQLHHLGYACDIAEDGEQAWDLWQKGRDHYRLLLTDCHMPLLDGYRLTERIRQAEVAGSLPRLGIVAITADTLLNEGENWRAIGIDGLIAKPIQMAALKQMLARMLSAPASSEVAEEIGTPTGPDFTRLSRFAGAAGLRRILDVFVESTRADLGQWARARQDNDYDALRKLAHKIKSGCKLIGDESTASVLEAIERPIGASDNQESLLEIAQERLSLILESAIAFKEQSGGDPH